MIDWNQKEIEAIIDCCFSIPDQEHPFQLHEAFFNMGGIHYCLNICPVTELVWLRADALDPDQATPHFEFSFRCDRIRTGDGGYKSKAIFFEFSNGNKKVDPRDHIRLVIDRLPNGNLYIWPIIGASDPTFDIDQLRRRATNGENAVTSNA
jgi:hypothetical protein